MEILYCMTCKKYTLKDKCPICSKKTVTNKPPRFSPIDKWGDYRRQAKKQMME